MSYEKAKELLEEKYPNCFVELSATPKPLKKGIKQDVVALIEEYPDILTRRGLNKYLTAYVNRPAYFKCVKVGAKRIDLEGNEVAEVNETEYTFTQERYKERLQVWKHRNKEKKSSKDIIPADKNQAEDIHNRKTLTLKKKSD